MPQSMRYSAGLTTRLKGLQPRAPHFRDPKGLVIKGLSEFGLMYVIREILKILVQFYQISVSIKRIVCLCLSVLLSQCIRTVFKIQS